MTTDDVDVVVIGGGAAGLTGALALARARRSVLVLDAGHPRNAPAAGVHGFLTREGMPPAEMVATGAGEVRSYGGVVEHDEAVDARADGDGFVVTTRAGREVRARRILLAAGTTDELPDVPGLREHWGHAVLHCPYCHGWEVRDQRIGVLATSPLAAHQAWLFRQWSDRVVLFANDAVVPSPEEAAGFAARDVAVVDGVVTAVVSEGDRLTGVRLADGRVEPVDALVVMPRSGVAPGLAGVLAGLGLEAVEHPRGTGRHVPSEAGGATAVPGVRAAGNVTDPFANVILSAAGAMTAASMLNAGLVTDDVRLALAARVPS